MKVLVTGGGTGGHIYPAIGLAERLLRQGDEVLYIGKSGGLEERLVPEYGIALQTVPAAPLERKISTAVLTTIGTNFRGCREALKIIEAFTPDAVVATGGYVALPVMAAAWLANSRRRHGRKAMLGLLEPNAVAGLTNRMLAPLVDEIWGSFPQGAGSFRDRFFQTGTPVRAGYMQVPSQSEARERMHLDPLRTTILVMGGSQGARSFNRALAELFAEPLPEQWQILQISGMQAFDEAEHQAAAAVERGEARVYAYLPDPLLAYAASDFVMARSGASTLAELAALGKPALLVPYPFATADHQRLNALAYIEHGAGKMLPDAELSGVRVRTMLHECLQPAVLHAMQQAAQKLSADDAAAIILSRIHHNLIADGAKT